MELLPGVRVVGIKPEILVALQITDGVYTRYGLPCRIKSVVDGNHSGGQFNTSSHYSGTSFDVAIPSGDEFTRAAAGAATPQELQAAIVAALGSEYFVSLNSAFSHFHISYMPQQP